MSQDTQIPSRDAMAQSVVAHDVPTEQASNGSSRNAAEAQETTTGRTDVINNIRERLRGRRSRRNRTRLVPHLPWQPPQPSIRTTLALPFIKDSLPGVTESELRTSRQESGILWIDDVRSATRWVPFPDNGADSASQGIMEPIINREKLALPWVQCEDPDCFLTKGHSSGHEKWSPCQTSACSRYDGHNGPHRFLLEGISRGSGEGRLKATEALWNQLTLEVLGAMTVIPSVPTQQDLQAAPSAMAVAKQPICASTNSSDREFSLPFRTIDSVPASGPRYGRLDTANHQVRLFRLHPHIVGSGVNGSFIHAQLQSQLQYIALSYTWGSQSSTRQIGIEGGDSIDIGENLWDFLQIQNRTISEPTLFWIDAICINQSDVHERNHQVGLMKQIYANAAEVFVWLGKAADDSDVAVRYLTNQASKPLRQRAQGYYPLWSEAEGRSLSALCERPYWRRMWIIQELLHAGIITVWCGSQHFAWTDIESLYLKLKEIERSNWFAHHRFHMAVMQSSAAVMLWQRAHWRHPKTPVPHLQTLIEIFKDWQCSDVRDKVFALVGMATQESAIVPDYGLSTKDMYLDVVRRAHGDQKQFGTLLSQILGLAGTDIALAAQEMIQYKTHSPEKLVFRARLNDWSDRSDHLS